MVVEVQLDLFIYSNLCSCCHSFVAENTESTAPVQAPERTLSNNPLYAWNNLRPLATNAVVQLAVQNIGTVYS